MRWNTNPSDLAPSTFEKDDAEEAAVYLKEGQRIGWEPGDGTRYEFEMVRTLQARFGTPHHFLRFCTRAWGGVTLPLSDGIPSGGYTAREYVLNRGPLGSYAGVRPLLAALGKAPGVLTLVPSDAVLEAKERERYTETVPYDVRDALLGRDVRLMVEARTTGTRPPQLMDMED